jgi:hypothetical protein
MSSELLRARVLQALRVRAGRWGPGLNRLASELRLTLERLGYEAVEPQIEAEPPIARLRIGFRSPSEAFGLLLHGGRPGMVHRHIAGYARQSTSVQGLDEGPVKTLLEALRQAKEEEPLPVLEIAWRRSWPRLAGLLHYRTTGGGLVGLVFDRVVGRTTDPQGHSMCRVALLSREATCIHLLDLVRRIVPKVGGHECLSNTRLAGWE